uniref:Putative late embryogenesis abundant protein, LEA-14 n=1 Tax=Tanacetum cinerariifolium TaxID=118510 RepID=A0A6L2NS40_TANCI|nr:putative late embryogenesis abundant protein, LEA-14 [Tanacetum cinerariifolium]
MFAIAFFAFVRSNLPDVKVHRIDIYKFNVTKLQNENKDTLEVDVRIMVNVTNGNKKMTLLYGKMKVETKVEGFKLPNVHLDGFKQNTMTTNDLKIHPQELRSTVNKDDAKELKLTADQNELVLSLKLKGTIQFWYNGRMLSKMYLKVSCEGIEKHKVDLAVAHECNVKLSFVRKRGLQLGVECYHDFLKSLGHDPQ